MTANFPWIFLTQYSTLYVIAYATWTQVRLSGVGAWHIKLQISGYVDLAKKDLKIRYGYRDTLANWKDNNYI